MLKKVFDDNEMSNAHFSGWRKQFSEGPEGVAREKNEATPSPINKKCE